MRYTVTYEVRAAFAAPVWEHHCEVRLTPQRDTDQRVDDVAVSVEPAAEVQTYLDWQGNCVHAFGIIAPHEALRVRGRAVVETVLANPFDFTPLPPAREHAWIDEILRGHPRLRDYVLHRSPCTPVLDELDGVDPAWLARDPAQPALDAVMAALESIAGSFESAPGFPAHATPLADALATGTGTCQDLAHLLVSVARAWGLPARYVTGYRDPGYAEEDAQTLHAWAQVLVPGAGWRGVDPTTGLVANDTYVTAAIGRDALDATPVKATYKGGDAGAIADVALEVTRDQ